MEQGEVTISSGKAYRIEIIPVRTRTASARVKEGRIVIRMPKMLHGEAAREMFENLKRRMVRSLEKYPERFEDRKFALADGQELIALGRRFTIRAEETAPRYSSARISDAIIAVRTLPGMDAAAKEAAVNRLAIRALSKELLPALQERVDNLNAAHFMAEINGIRIRNSSTRWGSYSKRSGKITLNFRLLFAPAEILDYVIIHELAHTAVRNHSERFWKVVGKALPDYAERRRWLRKHGEQLGR